MSGNKYSESGAPRFEALEQRLLLDAGQVVINEIMYHPGFADVGQTGYVAENLAEEYIELYNRGLGGVNLKDWKFSKGVSFTLPDVTIPQGGHLVVAADVAAFLAKYPTVDPAQVVGGWEGRLSNSGQDLELQDAAGQRMDFVSYADEGDWAVRRPGAVTTRNVSAITRSGTTATVTTATSHSFKTNSYVTISGAVQAEYNGVFKITNIDSTHFSYTVAGSPATPAAGTIIAEYGFKGWEWVSGADAGLKSLELLNAALSNEYGQNWAASLPDNGTPGAANSVAATDIAPLILDVQHLPYVPKSTEPVTLTARILDEQATGLTVRLLWRQDADPQVSPFTSETMYDDGLHGDGAAGDGVYGFIMPAKADRTVVEFYVEASDAGSHTRSWPAPTNDAGTAHGANALYQVADTAYTGTQPIYQLVIPAAEWKVWKAMMDLGHNEDYSNAQMSGTFLSLDGTDLRLRYTVGVRNRGEGTRNDNPHNMHVSFASDRPWRDLFALNLNTQYTEAQVAANAVFALAGLPAPYGTPVQVRVNSSNLANAGSPQFGSYFAFESYNSEWADAHLPEDPSGNIYKGVATSSPDADLRYINENPNSYRMSYFKQTNLAEDDWTDLIELVRVLDKDMTSDAQYTAEVSRVVDVDEWLRYFAVDLLIGNRENSLGGVGGQLHYQGDDYSLYRGMVDTRFQLLIHDLDTVLGQGDYRPVADNLPEGLFPTSSIPAIDRFMKWKDFAPLYFGLFVELAETAFSDAQIGAALDSALGGWIPPATIQAMKTYAAARRTAILARIPLVLSATSPETVTNGYPRTTAATTSLSGNANAIRTRSVLVNGVAATWTAWTASWSAAGIALNPGINKVLVQSLDADGQEFERAYVDVWYDTGAYTDVAGALPAGTTTWSPAGGQYRVTASVTVPAGATLVILPGTTVFFQPGTNLTVSGRLDAQGTDLARIRFTRTPGAASNWAGIYFNYGAYSAEVNRIAYADIAYSDSGSYSIKAQDAQVVLDHIIWSNHTKQYLTFDDSSIELRNSTLPDVSGAELIHYWGFPAAGYALFDGNWFGKATGYNDVIDFTGGQRPGPIVRFTNNVFTGGGDEALDLDGTDAHIEGNVFMNFHQDGNRASKSHAVATGTESGLTSDITVVGNLFYDCDHGILIKDGGFGTILNNTFVKIYKKNTGTDATTAAINLYEARSGQWQAGGVYLDGNIFQDVSLMFENPDWAGHPVPIEMDRCLFPDTGETVHWTGTGNSNEDPRLAGVAGIDLAQVNANTIEAFRSAFDLRPGSPAIGAGPNGVDIGGRVAQGASVSGEPVGTIYLTGATLTVGGPQVYGYRWRLDDGPWSAVAGPPALPVASITSSGTTATVTLPGHGYANGDVVSINGAAQHEYTGDYLIYNVTADTFQYTLPAATTSPATGTITSIERLDALPPIVLAGLANGPHHVDVIAMTSGGDWQDAAHPTASRTWTVDTAMAPHVRLSEVLAHNASAVPHGALWPDVVELYSDGHGTVDLAGMSLTDNPDVKDKFVFASGTTLAEGAYQVLYGGTDTVTPDDHLGFSLKGNGDTLYLYDSGGNLVDSVTFGIQLPDQSIARTDDGTWGLAQPTFGAANVLLRTGDPGTLKVNEWLTDGVVRFDHDFIEIYNPDPLPVDMGGLILTDKPLSARHKYEMHEGNPGLPGPSAIAPLSFIAGSPIVDGQAVGGYAVFIADDDPGQGADHTGFKLALEWGMVGLLASDASLIDQAIYGSQQPDVSRGRTPLGAAGFGTSAIPTPGIENPGATYGGTGTTVTTPLISSMTQSWNYLASASDPGLGTAWYQYSYPAGDGWPSGAGLLYLETNTAVSPRTTAIPPYSPNKPYTTYYFRTHFTFSGDPSSLTSFTLTTRLDDGALVYLNGVPLYNIRMPTSGVTYGTYATGMPPTNDAAADEAWSITATAELKAALRVGDNVLAVEVHQVSGSSDVVWGCKLDALATTGALREVTIPANVVALADDLRITELMYNAVGGSDYEYVELKNTSATTTLDLAGVRLTNGVDYVFSDADPNRMLAPGAYIVVAANQAEFRTRYGSAPVLAAGVYSGKLSDSGEGLTLKLPAPYEAAMLRFNYQPTWYPATAGGGKSLVIVSPAAPDYTWDRKQSWKASAAVNGSPGADEPLPSSGTVIITELMTHSDQDPPEGIGDWIELHNTSLTDPVDISGWYLSDTGADLQLYPIGLDTVLGPNEYKVFTERDDFGEFFALSELGEEAHLTNPAGTYHEIANFTAAEREVAFGRFTNSIGVTEYVPMDHATLGLPNSDSKIGPVILSEIMYHPLADGDEFIELKNTTGADVPLYDLAHPENGWQFTNGIEFAFSEGDVVPAGGYALVVGGDPEAFRAKYGIPDSVPIYGPWSGNLENAGETVTLKKPGDPEPGTGFVPYYMVDHVLYDNVSPWPMSPDGTGPSLVRANESGYGNEVLSWAAGPAYGTPGGVAGAAPPQVVTIRLNGRDRGAGGVDPSGLGVRTIEVRFSKAVAFLLADVTVQTVTFEGGVETVVAPLTPTVGVGGTDTMTISLDAGAAWDTWVKVTLSGSGTLRDLMSHLLDGEPAAGGSGLGYLYAAADLPSGDGLQGGDAVFYVGSLRGDLDLDRAITPDDKAAFAAKWRDQDLDADFRGVGFGVRPPDGRVTIADINGFTSAYQAGLAVNKELAALPGTGGGPAGGATPLPLLAVALATEDLLAMAAGQVGPLLALAAPAPLGESPGRPTDPLQVRKPAAAATADEGPMPVLRI
ncbi:MAG: lamin tail domain-containing protein [Planctomycetes bacterium]|nr:lamin tail domain-containing protein [Planctomycetota bacterium]